VGTTKANEIENLKRPLTINVDVPGFQNKAILVTQVSLPGYPCITCLPLLTEVYYNLYAIHVFPGKE